MMNIPDWAWIAWGATSFVSFLVLELVALQNHKYGDTLSENIRRWLGMDPPNSRRQIAVPAFVALLVGFVIWFVPHIVLSVW